MVRSYQALRVSQRYIALLACFASVMVLQRIYANALGSMKGFLRKLRDIVIRYNIKEENM